MPIIFIVSAVASLFLAAQKNRNTVKWFFLGLIFPPIPPLILLFLKKLPK
tara:strand:+ start:215 stop:364 length:150 start_codon:yes stop_codon:yes gene_type:complete